MIDPKINILIVDDHPVFLNGLNNILRRNHYIGKVHQAKNGLIALQIIEKENVDIVLMDIEMPEMNGVQTTLAIHESKPEIKVIVLTMFCNPKLIYEMCKIGAKGYLLKDSHPHEISKAINMVNRDQEYYSPKVQGILAQVCRLYDKSLPNFNPDLLLTHAQVDVLKLICRQYSTEEISQELKISAHTVKHHREEIMKRTESKNLVGIVIYAIEHGYLNADLSNFYS